LKLYFN